jgi:YafQ family addiction module toxin component
MEDDSPYILVLSATYKRTIKKLKSRNITLLKNLERGITKILREPELGKPLRHTLRNYRRIHIAGSFVLLYEVRDLEVYLIDFDHHDRVYKKYS